MHLVEAQRLVLDASRLAGADCRRVAGNEIVVAFDLDAVARALSFCRPPASPASSGG